MYYRDSSKNISKVCDGFFKDPRHLEEHFFYLTESKISAKIEKGLVGHLSELRGKFEAFFVVNNFLGNLEIYLESVNDTLEFREKMEKVNDDCALQFRGSSVHKYIHLLVCRRIFVFYLNTLVHM